MSLIVVKQQIQIVCLFVCFSDCCNICQLRNFPALTLLQVSRALQCTGCVFSRLLHPFLFSRFFRNVIYRSTNAERCCCQLISWNLLNRTELFSLHIEQRSIHWMARHFTFQHNSFRAWSIVQHFLNKRSNILLSANLLYKSYSAIIIQTHITSLVDCSHSPIVS